MAIETATATLNMMSYEEAFRKFARECAKKRLHAKTGDALTVRVNCNRWIADCACGAGVACEQGWPFALCFDCGTKYPIEWPSLEQQQVVEAMLADRPKALRSWEADETVDQLAKQNQLLDIPVEKTDARLAALSAEVIQ